MYLQEIETKSKKLGGNSTLLKTPWTVFSLHIYCPVKTNRLWTETV